MTLVDPRFLTPSNRRLTQLCERERDGNPIRVAVIGAGDYGDTLVCQLQQIPGMRPAVVCDLDREKAAAAYEMAGIAPGDVTVGESAASLADAVSAGRPTVTQDLDLAVAAPVDVVVDCTGEPEVGCRAASGAIDHRHHIVMVNVEADVTVGHIMVGRAARAGVVYSLADGDQPSLITGLVDWVRCLGFDVVCAGKSTTHYPPDLAARKLAERCEPTKSDVTYFDGTKTQIEMASTANANGLTIDVVGLHGPGLNVDQIPGVLRPSVDGGMLSRSGVVDYVNTLTATGDPLERPLQGVFVVVTTGPERSGRAMAAKGVVVSEDGRHALFYRPHHMVGAETAWTIQRVVLDRLPTAAWASQNAEVVAVAKLDLRTRRLAPRQPPCPSRPHHPTEARSWRARISTERSYLCLSGWPPAAWLQ